MGVTSSCPLGAYCDLDNGFESVLVKSIASPDHVYEEKAIECQDLVSEGMAVVEVPQLPVLSPGSPKHLAAVKLQKVYKSFRTRRKLADCAVLIEQSWWKLLDFAELKHSSISFFDTDKHETAISRWSRARTRAAKVGKGLSKNSRAQKLALQHWLEAIDPRHRYGHNLHFYYVKWLHSQSKEPFFYWLDIGEGKEVNLVEKCPRWKLHQQCIKYLGPIERKAYEVTVENGQLVYQQTGEMVDTASEPKAKWIFVLSATRTMYVGKKRKGTFQHSSFLAGGATLAAGRLVVEKGVLKAVWPHSGHYRPTPENFQDFISFLKENNVDLTDVNLDASDESEESSLARGNGHVRNNSEEDLSESLAMEVEEAINKVEENAEQVSQSVPSVKVFASKLSNLEIPNNDGLLLSLKSKNDAESPSDGYETAEESFAQQPKNAASSELFDGIKEDESILQRISSHKSFQRKWSTGAGPRIGCLRDYPSELQCHALEEANLSPRSGATLLQRFSSSSNLNKSPFSSPLLLA